MIPEENREKAQIIIDTAAERVRELDCGVVADGTVYGNGVWIDELRAVISPRKIDEHTPTPRTETA